jgi:hypothetical protein
LVGRRKGDVLEGEMEVAARERVPVSARDGEGRSQGGERRIRLGERVQRSSLVPREEDVGDVLKEDLGGARQRRETRASMAEPAGAVTGTIVASGEMVIVQHRNSRSKVQERLQ